MRTPIVSHDPPGQAERKEISIDDNPHAQSERASATQPLESTEWLYGCAFSLVAVGLGCLSAQGGVWLALVWPAVSFSIVGGSYLRGSPSWFGKRRDGSRTVTATIVLGPYLAFAIVAWRLQIAISREPAWNRVNDSLLVSRRLLRSEATHEAAAICDLTCEFRGRASSQYVSFPILDAAAAPPEQLLTWAAALNPQNLVSETHDTGGGHDGQPPARPSARSTLLVHCAQGHGRTGMFAAVWLVVHGFAESVEESLGMLQAARPGIRLRPRQLAAVEQACRLWHSEQEQARREGICR